MGDLLRAATSKTLLQAFAALTHRMHESPEDNLLRAQRDLVEAEILRRMEEGTE